jgi:hypothetical protein
MTCHTTPKQSSSRESSLRVLALGTLALTFVAVDIGCGGSIAAAPDGDGGGQTNHDGGVPADAGNPPGDASVRAPDSGAIGPSPMDSGVMPSNLDSAPPSAMSDANGAASSVYPAFPVNVAQVTDNGGPVLSAPVIVTVTWSVDTDAPTWNAFGDAIGPSPYWHAINSEYGVGASTSGPANHVSITTAPPSEFADSDLDALVTAHAGTDWPAPTANTIYAIYLPPGSPLYFGGPPDAGGQDACAQGVGGYHEETQDGKHSVYAIMPHCSGFQTADIELSASHELNEAATDPHPDTNLAYAGFDQDHLAFEFFNQFQDELGDACEAFVEATDAVDFTPYTVQRQWSNKSASAGSHWCLPALNEPFYNTTFLPTTTLDAISVDLSSLGVGASITPSKGIKVALNQSRTFAIGYFSDRATSGPFTLDVQGLNSPIAQDQNGNVINNGTATVTIDKTSGVNGDIANVTVTPSAYSSLGIVFFYVRAVLPNATQHHYLPILISQN